MRLLVSQVNYARMDCVLTHPAGRFFIFARDKRVLAGPTEQCKAMIERSAFLLSDHGPLRWVGSFALKSAKQNETTNRRL